MAPRERPGPTVSLAEARQHLLAAMVRLEPRRVPLDESMPSPSGSPLALHFNVPAPPAAVGE